MPEPYQLSVAEAAGEIRSGSLSPVELAQSLLGRIDALEPSLRAWVTIDREEVLTEAKRRADELAQGGPKGPAVRGSVRGLSTARGVDRDLSRARRRRADLIGG